MTLFLGESCQLLERRGALWTEAFVWRPNGPGTGLFSRGLVTPVSWALERFTTVFGMGTGGSTPLSPPGPIGRHASNLFSARKLNRQYIGPLRCTSPGLEVCTRGGPRVPENMDPADLMKRKIEARALGH